MNTLIQEWFEQHRLTVIVGHSGSGKTELSVNLALWLAQTGRKTALADLDVVNPYFRSRERADLLNENHIRLITSSQACMDADLPSMPVELNTLLDDESMTGILDIGGDAAGARVLARYKPKLQKTTFGVLFVVNANRPLTSSPERAFDYMRRIEQTIGLPVNGIINNTHMCRETSMEDVLTGKELAGALSVLTGIPVIGHTASAEFTHEFKDCGAISESMIPIQVYMKKPWE